MNINNEKHFGETNISVNGHLMLIRSFRNENDIDVCFDNGIIVTNQKYDDFVNGNIVCD